MFDSILRTLAPPTKYLDPQGNQQMTKPSLSASILSGALAGMLTKDTYHEGAYGPIRDNMSGDAFKAGQAQAQEKIDATQKLSDDMQARKLSNAKNNTDAMHIYASLTQAQFAAEKEGAEASALNTKNLQNITDQNQSGILASVTEHDKNLNQGETKALLTSGMTMDELMASPFSKNLLSQNMIMDGTRSVYDPATKTNRTVPTFSVLDPTATIKLNQDLVDRVSKINPQFKGMFQATAGNVRLSVGQAVAINHQMTSVDHAEDLLQSVADSKDPELMKLGIKGDITSKLATAVQGNPSAMRSVMDFENGVAHGGDTSQQLNRLLQSDGSDAIFKALGTDRDKVKAYVRSVDRKNAKENAMDAAAGKVEVKEAAKPQTAKEAADLVHTNLENQTLQDKLNDSKRVGDTSLTGDEYMKTLNPQDQAQLKAIYEGRQELNSRMLATKEGKILSQQLNAAYPDFDQGRAPAYFKMRQEMTSGKDARGINALNVALQHLSQFDDNVSAWSTVPGLRTLTKLSGNAAAKLDTDRTALAAELATAYKGTSATDPEIKEWNDRLSSMLPGTLRAGVREAATMLRGKLGGYQNQWDTGAPKGVVSPIQIIGHNGRAAYEHIMGEKLPHSPGDVVTVKGQQMRITSIGEDGTAQVMPYGAK
jgi:hypothetical protein